MEYRAPTPAGVKAFAQRLTDRGVNVHVRHSRGADTHAACGQLRGRTR
jgi:adenine C2-methylase RlmN of 23S rRNA A2503 and tRNA A37